MLDITEECIMQSWEHNTGLPLVTIINPVYNHEKYLEECLDGFLIQKTTFMFEVISHDDASTDSSREILQKYQKKYPHIIKPIYEEENLYSKKGSFLRDRIYKHIDGKYIALCEGDDFWTDPNKLQNQVDGLEQNQDCSISFCRVRFVEKDGKLTNRYAPPLSEFVDKDRKVDLREYTNIEFIKGEWTFHTSSFLYRTTNVKKWLENMENAFKRFPYGDMPMILTNLLIGKGYFVNKVQSCYRTDSGGYNSRVKLNRQFAIEQERRLIDALSDFDELTQGQYHKAIQRRMDRGQYKILDNEYDEYGEVRSVKICLRYIVSWGLKCFCRGSLLAYFPHLGGKIIEFKKKIIK